MKIQQLARRSFKSISRSYGGVTWPWMLPQTTGGKDWNREAGLRYDNSIVYAAIRYAVSKMNEVDIYVRRRRSDGEFEEIADHPITQLLNYPNPWYDKKTLMSGWVISELAGRAGMSYTFKHRSSAGKLVGLEYVPHHAVMPYWAPTSGNFIDYYRISMAGGYKPVDVKDILAQRYGPMNPWRPQESIGPLEAALLEVVTDQQAANYTAALLYNVGVTPHLISPDVRDKGTEIIFGKEQRDQIEKVWDEKISGDNKGRPLIAPIPLRVDNISMKPSDMNLEAIRNISEERICSVLGLPPHVLNLGTGLENSNNRASAEAVARQAARDFVVPYMRQKASQLTFDLVPELGDEGDEIAFRTDAIDALQEDKTETATRDKLACGGAWETVNEVRKRRGLNPIEGGDELRQFSGQDDEKKDFDGKEKLNA